jgi:hypothetical protein
LRLRWWPYNGTRGETETKEVEASLHDQISELKNSVAEKDRDKTTLELKLRLRIRELREKLHETECDKKEAECTLRYQREYYEKKQQERDANNEIVEDALNGMLIRLHTQILERESELHISRAETRFEKERAIRQVKRL